MKRQTIERDSILEEIHEVRRQIADKFDCNISAILEDARKRQEASGRPIWQGGSKKAQQSPPSADDEQ